MPLTRTKNALLAATLIAPVASAHHSFAPHFDIEKPVSISGTVKEFEARNPHSYLHIEAVDENGKTQEYVCESHGYTQLSRNGITPEMLKPGTQLRIDGSRSRTDAHACFFNNLYFPDGRTLNVNGPTGAQSARAPGPAGPPRQDIFGTWLLAPIPNRSTSGPQPMMQFLTDAGKAAVAKYDPFRDDPTFRCDPVAIRRVWGAPGTPLSITREGDRVVLRHEWMDVRRVIYLNEREHPKDGPRTSLGHSIGHFEGDTLVIETGNYSAGVLNQYVEQPGQPTRGLLHSAALTSVERLHLDAARQRLVVEITLKDPEFFTRDFDPATLEYAPSDLKLEPFNCSPEGVNGTLKK
ncbi:MAG TPA: DUF6152 family protein [Gammaproteobacteria bacterium]|nr:DUF6152 family protein [Gammaproteobacteria bacterium]